MHRSATVEMGTVCWMVKWIHLSFNHSPKDRNRSSVTLSKNDPINLLIELLAYSQPQLFSQDGDV